MRKLFTVFLLIALFDFGTGISQVPPSRGEIASECPVIKWIDYPKELDYGAPVRFEVSVDARDVNTKLKYTWIVSAGKIQSGQGTKAILVSMKGYGGQSLTAMVVICGLPYECENTASASSVVY